nr:MAG: hypothetical protein EDM05_27480 [Leptolyngbya sp. IPPAS B-1204]
MFVAANGGGVGGIGVGSWGWGVGSWGWGVRMETVNFSVLVCGLTHPQMHRGLIKQVHSYACVPAG